MSETIAVLGAGSWGTALAVHCARLGHDVRLWARDPLLVDEVAAVGENTRYLHGVSVVSSIRATARLERALEQAGVVIAAVPSHGMRAVLRDAAPFVSADAILVSAAKGIERDTLERMSQVIAQEISGRRIVVLSGPSFAIEVARGLPTALVAASPDRDAASHIQETLKGPALRLYASDDVAGVEIGGALKNVIAIAAGVVEGLQLGHNAMAALITRGLVEISRLACAEGARRDTLSGLSGLGDLVLTCTGDLSRNRQVGIQLGRGRAINEILAHMRMVAEGVRTTSAALALGERRGVELPIAAQMAAVLEGRSSPLDALETLMLRRQRAEIDQ
ncbi:MAG TPA: NAD(P)H-dependent glycerol-3-phosphate dehydrogenase [Vicinamibacterales bacterium]|nr:NAD(P)H-dependent glycerol-3-phosphate dehydrogenase [Vicinamibacterales bacterium]